MLTIGLLIFVSSLLANSSVAAIIALGLTFWGALLLYIRPQEPNRKTLIEAAVSPSLATLNELIQKLGYKGDIVYLPPKYFTNADTTKIYIARDKNGSLPTPEQTRTYENTSVSLAPQAMLLTPPGIQLSKLLEKAIGKDFTRTTLESLQQKLPKIFIEDYEIAENLEIKTAENITMHTTTDTTEKTRVKQDHSQVSYCYKCGTRLNTDSKFCHFCGTQVAPVAAAPPRPPALRIASTTTVRNAAIHARITHPADGLAFKEDPSVDSPICSAIAIAITKATSKPVRIMNTETYDNGNIVEANYVIMEE